MRMCSVLLQDFITASFHTRHYTNTAWLGEGLAKTTKKRLGRDCRWPLQAQILIDLLGALVDTCMGVQVFTADTPSANQNISESCTGVSPAR